MFKILLAGVVLGIPIIGLLVVVRLAWWGYQSVLRGAGRPQGP